MSTCNNHSNIHNHSPMFANTTGCPTHQYSLGQSAIRRPGHFFNIKPPNPIQGDIYLNESSQKLWVWDSNAWIVVDPGKQENIVDQFDVVTDNEGFFKVKLYDNTESNQKSIMIWDGDDIFIDDTQKSIDFLKRNLKDKYYLWVEKRLLNHLG